MIKAAIQKILDLAPPTILQRDGREYSNQALHGIKKPTPEPLTIHTLTGIVDYIKDSGDTADVPEGEGTIFIHVLSPATVALYSNLMGPWVQRNCYLKATLADAHGFPFGHWLDPETFIISLQAQFVPDATVASILAMVGTIKDEVVKTSGDDGYSQTVTAKAGIALVGTVAVPNPVTLAPYRTFMEVEQPASSFILRLRKGVEISLHEADGGQWRLKAIQNIKNFLATALPNIPVIA
jgi:hypothetical protein